MRTDLLLVNLEKLANQGQCGHYKNTITYVLPFGGDKDPEWVKTWSRSFFTVFQVMGSFS